MNGLSVLAKVLVTVKAYPVISTKHGEAVCVAGIRTDSPEPQWVRLYPIRFRDLPPEERFKKYDEIEARVTPSSDVRPESLRLLPGSLHVIRHLGTRDHWDSRRAWVDPLITSSMCQILRDQRARGTSLGAFRPAKVDAFEWTPNRDEWSPAQQRIVNQLSLFEPTEQTPLKRQPYRFYYRYRCADPGCINGHFQSVVDWELAQTFFRWRASYGEKETLERIRDRWLGDMFSPGRDPVLFVGNQRRYPNSFMVLGVFWPPTSDGPITPKQLSLGLDCGVSQYQ